MAMGPAARLRVDADGIRLASPDDLEPATHDVVIDAHRVWSFSPVRDLHRHEGGWLVPWPKALRPHLAGRGPVVVREHLSGRVVSELELDLGDGALRVALADGTPLAIDKTGRLSPMFAEDSGSVRERLADEVVRLLDFINHEAGLPAYLAFGGLLGAVREDGHFIGHDNDADIGFLSASEHPADIVLESFALERRVQRAGWRTRRMSGDDFKAMVDLPGGGSIGIDVFGSFYLDHTFHLLPNVIGAMPRDALLPLGTVQLEGRSVAAPAQPERLLALTYGEGWRTPDPAFRFEPRRSTRRRFTGWFRGERDQLRRWDEELDHAAPDPGPSSFAAWVAPQLEAGCTVADVGAGVGGDSAFFARRGHPTTALDYSSTACAALDRLRAAEPGLPLEVGRLNLYDLREVLTVGALTAHAGGVGAVYSHGVLGWLKDEGRRSLWLFSRTVLGPGGRAFVDFDVNERRAHDPLRGEERGLSHVRVLEEVEQLGGVVERCDLEDVAGPGGSGHRLTCRLVVRWS